MSELYDDIVKLFNRDIKSTTSNEVFNFWTAARTITTRGITQTEKLGLGPAELYKLKEHLLNPPAVSSFGFLSRESSPNSLPLSNCRQWSQVYC
jgi:hypothetical protein